MRVCRVEHTRETAKALPEGRNSHFGDRALVRSLGSQTEQSRSAHRSTLPTPNKWHWVNQQRLQGGQSLPRDARVNQTS